MTGLELKEFMENHHLSLQTVAVRVSCILDRPVTGARIRAWASQNAKLDPALTQQGILNEHSKGFMWEK